MATVNPELSVRIKFDTPTLQSELQAAEGLILRSTEVTEAKLLSSDKLHQQKLAQQREMAFKRYQTSREIAEQRALDRSTKAQTSWSAKMTKNLESLTMMAKGFFAAWAGAQVSSMIKNSVAMAGGMRELADGIGVTTQEYFALSSAMRDAGASAEKLDPIFSRLNEITSGGATSKQSTVLTKLGIADGTLVTSIDLLDQLIKGFNSGKVSANDLGEIVGNRVVPSFRRLAAEITSVNEANSKYKFPLTEAEVKRLDEITAAWQRAETAATLYFGGIFADIASWQERVARHLLDIDGIQHTFGKLETLDMRFGGRDFIPAAFRRRAPQFAGQMVGPPVATPSVTQAGRATPASQFIPSFAQGQAAANLDAAMDSTRRMNQEILNASVATKEWLGSLREIPVATEDIALTMEEKLRNVQQVIGSVQNAMSGVFSMQSMLFQNEIAHLQAMEDRERERWESRSQMLRDAGLESSALYKREAQAYEKAQKDRQKKQTKLQSKAWEMEKIARIGTITMDIASAIMKAWATTVPTWLAPATAALASASGAVQLGIVASQQNPYKGFAFGGMVPGRGYADDVPINATPGEFVSTRESTERNRGALEFGNRGGKIGAGGGVTIVVQGDIIGDQRYVESKLIPNLQKALDRGHRLRLK